MAWMKRLSAPRSRSSSNQRNKVGKLSIFRPACGLSSVWPTEGRAIMRKYVVTAILALLSGPVGNLAAAAVPAPAEQAKSMDEVIARVVASENKLNADMRKYSPLVETYIQN